MCGILASLSFTMAGAPDGMTEGLAALAHRGPDGSGCWRSADGRVALGHTRLAVVCPADPPQPVSNERGDVVAVINGEIYDRDRRRRELEARGHRFATQGDSELLVHLYEDLGDDLVGALRGEFAFCLWDARRRRLLVARDRFGARPVVYQRTPGALRVASEAKALFAMGCAPSWSVPAVLEALTLQYPAPQRTLFAGIEQLPAGHLLVAADGGLHVRRWYQPPTPDPALDEAEAAAAVAARLDEAVRLRLGAHAAVAFHLSGGLDSSAVLALAARHVPAPQAFTVAFGRAGWDEVGGARDTARALGAALHVVEVGADRALDHLPAAVAQGEGLAINAHIAAKHALSRAVREAGFAVVLTGEGADELFGGYPHLHEDLLARRGERVDREANLASAGVQLPEGDGLPMPGVRDLLGFVPSFLEAKATLGLRVARLMRPDLAPRVEGGEAFRAVVAGLDPTALRRMHRVDASARLWTRLCLSGYILRTLADAQEMAHGVEGRLPFLDREVADLAARIPVSLKIAGGVVKRVLRDAMEGVVPDPARTRPKHPFMAPPLCAARPAWFRELFASAAAADQPFFEPARALALLDRLPEMPLRDQVASEPALMTAASTVLLQQAYRP